MATGNEVNGYKALLAKNKGRDNKVMTPWRPSWVLSLKATVLDKNNNPKAIRPYRIKKINVEGSFSDNGIILDITIIFFNNTSKQVRLDVWQ